MKTATITWVTYNNYGTLLQAYALQNYLGSIHIQNTILSDSFIINSQNNKKVPVVSDVAKKCRIKKYLFQPKRIATVAAIKWKKKKNYKYLSDSSFLSNHFRDKFLVIDYAVSKENLETVSKKYDAFICGSDQIWSAILQLSDYYYLQFTEKKRIAYAPSMSSVLWSEEYKETLKDYLSNFHAISTREFATSQMLYDLLHRDVKYVCDPTLLLTQTQWEELCFSIRRKKQKYILGYFLDNKSWYFLYAKEMAKKLGMKFVLIPSCPSFTLTKYCLREAVGPIEFVSLIRDASYIITDSYHGTIFSLLFKKKISVLKRFEDSDHNNQNVRIISLMKTLGFEDVFCEKVFQVDFSPSIIQDKLIRFREESQVFLKTALGVI